MIRNATPEDQDAIDAFLTPYTETSMFLRGNLHRHGLGKSDHPHAMRMFIEEYDGEIAGIGAFTNDRMVMIQTPDGVAALGAHMRDVAPENLRGMVGASDQVAALKTVLGLDDLPMKMNDVEPLFTLALDDLHIPQTDGLSIRLPEKADLPLLNDWRRAYIIEAMNEPDNEATTKMAKDASENAVESGNYRILMRDGQCVSFTGFNTTLSDTVQIGGVFTPPELRSQGLARTAVAMHLAEAKGHGINRAILFASGEPAVRAYRGIGFEQVGHFTIVLFGEN